MNVTLHGKSDFADLIKDFEMREISLGHPGGSNVITRVHIRERGEKEGQRRCGGSSRGLGEE